MKLLGAEIAPSGLLEKHWLHTDGMGNDQITVERVQDVAPILKSNIDQFNSAPGTFERKSDIRKVAEIPVVVIEEALRVNQITLQELMDQKTEKSVRIWNDLLNSRDFQYFRTSPGVVTVRGR